MCPEGINFPPRGNGGKEKKIGFSLYSSSSANTGIVKQSAKHFALRGWTSGGTIIMTHFSLSLLDSSVTRGVLGMRNQASLFNGTRATAIRPFLFPRVPWVMEKVTVTRIELLRPLWTDIKQKNSSNHLLYLNLVFCLSVETPCTMPYSPTLRCTSAL